ECLNDCEVHPFLASYYLWPPTAWFILLVYQGEFTWRGFVRAKIGIALFLIALGLGGIYYALFASFFLLIATLAAAWRDGERRLLTHGVGALLLIAMGAGANLLPSWLYLRSGAVNPDATRRSPAEAEYYGLKLTQLILPIKDHR